MLKRIADAIQNTQEEKTVAPVNTLDLTNVFSGWGQKGSNSSIIYGGLNQISNAIGRSDFIVKRDGVDVTRDEDIGYYLNLRPNPSTTAKSFWQKIVSDMVWHGNAYALILTSREGKLLGFRQMNYSEVSVFENNGILSYSIDGKYIPESKILHFRNALSNSLMGVGAKSYLWDTLMQNEDNKRIYIDSMNRAAKMMGTLTLEANNTQEDIDRFVNAIMQSQSLGSNAILPMRPGMKYEQIKSDNPQIILMDLFKLTVQEVSTALNLPIQLLGEDQEMETEDLMRNFVERTLQPHAIEIVQELLYKLAGFDGYKTNLTIEINVQKMIQPTLLERAQMLELETRSGYLSLNEARKETNRAPLTGLDVTVMTKNYDLFVGADGENYWLKRQAEERAFKEMQLQAKYRKGVKEDGAGTNPNSDNNGDNRK